MSAQVDIDVPFHDVDSMDVVWHGHYVKYLEVARCVLLEQLGYPYDVMLASGYTWPIVDMRLRYVGSALFKQRITVTCELIEWEHRLVLDYLIADAASGKRLTRATTVQVAVDKQTGEMMMTSPRVLLDLVAKVIA